MCLTHHKTYTHRGLRAWLKVVECLPSKHKTLSSNPPSTVKKKKSYTHRCAIYLLTRLYVSSVCCCFSQIIGCQVRRDPPNSTERYTRWINQLASNQLLTQVTAASGWSSQLEPCEAVSCSMLIPLEHGLCVFICPHTGDCTVIRLDTHSTLLRYNGSC
jgi:predicted RNA-binding Zn-ribbon protein involved in translation (DUF1610 family)